MELAFLRLVTHPVAVWILRSKPASFALRFILNRLRSSQKKRNAEVTNGTKFVISYGGLPSRLTAMSLNATKLAREHSTRLYGRVFGCEFSGNPPGAQEYKLKSSFFDGKFVNAGLASNTINEHKELIREALHSGEYPASMIVYGNGYHLLRVEVVCRHYNPGSRFVFIGTNPEEDDDPENPMIAQRYWQVWGFVNLVGLVAFKVLGVEYFDRPELFQLTQATTR